MRKLSDRVARDRDRAADKRVRRDRFEARRIERALAGPRRLSIHRAGDRIRIRIRPAPLRAVVDLVAERGAGATMEMAMAFPITIVGVVFTQIFLQVPLALTLACGMGFLIGAIALLAAFDAPYAGYTLVIEGGWVHVRGRGQLGYIAPLKTVEFSVPQGTSHSESVQHVPGTNTNFVYRPAGKRRLQFSVRLNREDGQRIHDTLSEQLRTAPDIAIDELEHARPQRSMLNLVLTVLLFTAGALAVYLLAFGRA